MAIKINNTTVIDDNRQFANVGFSVVGSPTIPDSWASGGNLSEVKTSLTGLGDSQSAALAVGGRANTTTTSGLTTTEEYNGTSWSLSGSLNAGKFGAGGAGVQDAALVFGGTSSGVSTATSELYDGTSWYSSSSLSIARTFVAGFGTSSAAVAVGGNNGATYYGTTEYFFSDTWTTADELPGFILRTAMSGAGTVFAGLAIGGASEAGVRQTATWEYFDGMWAAGGNLNLGRSQAAAAGTQTAAIVMGGYDTNGNIGTTSVEVYDGTTWSIGTSLSVPSWRAGGAGTQAAAMIFGGDTSVSATTSATYEFTTGVPGVIPTTSGNKGELRYNNHLGRFEGFQNSWDTVSPVSFIVCGANNIVSTVSGTGGTGCNNFFAGRCTGISNATGTSNIFMGNRAGACNTSGGNNFFAGNYAGCSNATGTSNIFMGNRAGACNTSGGNNFFAGNYAGNSNTTGNNNIFIGNRAGICNTTGGGNFFAGSCAGSCNVSGSSNIMIGFQAGYNNAGGGYNAFLGFRSGFNNTSGQNNVFMGSNSGRYNSTGSQNVGIGHYAGYNNCVGTNNVFLGAWAGKNANPSNRNTFLGSFSGCSATTGINNTFIGFYSGCAVTSGANNVIIGAYATGTAALTNTIFIKAGTNCLQVCGSGSLLVNGAAVGGGPFSLCGTNNIVSCISGNGGTGTQNFFAGLCAGMCNTTASSNIFLGLCAGAFNTTGAASVFIGAQAGFCSVSGLSNVFIGRCAGFNSVNGICNIAIGEQAGYAGTTTCHNVMLGYQTGYSTTTGTYNFFVGRYSGYGVTTGTNNIMFGKRAGYLAQIAQNNFIAGQCAGYNAVQAQDNVIIGQEAGKCISSGTNNFIFGKQASLNHSYGTYNISIGQCAAYCNTGGSHNINLGLKAGWTGSLACHNFFAGVCAGYANTGCCNVAIGPMAMLLGAGGCNNVALGFKAGNQFTGCYNFAVGKYALANSTGGNHNIGLGFYSGLNSSSGCFNVFMGQCTGYCNTTGCYNVYIGYRSGIRNQGSNNIFISARTDSSGSVTSDSNTVILATGGIERIKANSSGLFINGSGYAVGKSGLATSSGAIGALQPLVLNTNGTITTVSSALQYGLGSLVASVKLESGSSSNWAPDHPGATATDGNYLVTLYRNKTTSAITISVHEIQANNVLLYKTSTTTTMPTGKSNYAGTECDGAAIAYLPTYSKYILIGAGDGAFVSGPSNYNALAYTFMTYDSGTNTITVSTWTQTYQNIGSGPSYPFLSNSSGFYSHSVYWNATTSKVVVIGGRNTIPYAATYTTNGTTLTPYATYNGALSWTGNQNPSRSNYPIGKIGSTDKYWAVSKSGSTGYLGAYYLDAGGSPSAGSILTLSSYSLNYMQSAASNNEFLTMYWDGSSSVKVRRATFNGTTNAFTEDTTYTVATGLFSGGMPWGSMSYDVTTSKFVAYIGLNDLSTIYLYTSTDGTSWTQSSSVAGGSAPALIYADKSHITYLATSNTKPALYVIAQDSMSNTDVRVIGSPIVSLGSVSNLTGNNFIGFSDVAANTATAVNFWSLGDTATGFTGLTINTDYYVDGNGNLSNTEVTANGTAVYVGTSISANAISIKNTSKGGVVFYGNTVLQQTAKSVSVKSGATGTVTHDYSSGDIFFHTGMAASFTLNLTNVPKTNNRNLMVTTILDQGATPYIPNAVQVDGSATTLKWLGGSAPTGNANKTDIVQFNLIKTTANSSWLVTGELKTYG